MNSEVKEVDSSVITEVAANVGAVDSQTKPIARTVLSDLGATNNLTSEERDDLQKLEKKFAKGQRESAAALREIRERKLYRQDFPSFDTYVETRWHKTRQWATQLINWLRRSELLQAIGKDPYQSLTVDDAQALGPLEEHPELFVTALEEAQEEANRAGKKRTKKHLQEAVKRRTDYLSLLANVGVPDLTYEESRALARLGAARQSKPNFVEEAKATAQTEGRPLSDCLLEVCQSRHFLPPDNQLLAVARGKDLESLVQPLVALKAHWDEIAELQEKRRKLVDELDEIDEQVAPPDPTQPQGSQAQGLGPESAGPAAPEAEEKGESDEESEDEPGTAYRVQLTGAFERIATGCFFGGGAEMNVDADQLPDLFSVFAESLGGGFSIDEESSITVTPMVTDEADEDDATEEPEDDLDDDDEAGDE